MGTYGEIGMSQGATGAVERITVAVLAFLKTYLYVDIARGGGELEVGVFGPNTEGAGYLGIYVFFDKFWWIFGDFVGEVLRLPTTS